MKYIRLVYQDTIRLAARLPAAHAVTCEVRPVLAPGSDMADPVDRRIGAAMRRNVQGVTG